MNKILKIVQVAVVIIYLLINIYIMALNWSVYSVPLKVDYGFGVVEMPLVFTMIVFGLFTVLLMWLISYIKSLRYEVRIIKAEDELLRIKERKATVTNSTEHDSGLQLKIDHIQKQIDALEKKQKGAGDDADKGESNQE